MLQAQLFQDININPVQPSLSENNFGIITSGGPARPGFNEFTPLFERNQAQLNTTGVVGNKDTLADEVVVSGIYDNISLSAGHFHYRTDGFRNDFDYRTDIENLFAQAAITPELNAQAEFRRRRTRHGDLKLNFSQDQVAYRPTENRDIDQDTGRLGLRFSPNPRSDFIASLIYSNRDQESSADPGQPRSRQKGYEGEAAYILRHEYFNMITGFGMYEIDEVRGGRPAIPGSFVRNLDAGMSQATGYVYYETRFPQNLEWTLGVSYDDYKEEDLQQQKFNPKAGVQWHVTDDLRVRAAAFRVLKPALLANQTIQPTQIAGFNQFFDDRNGSISMNYDLGVDVRLLDGVYAGVEGSMRDLDFPGTDKRFAKVLDRDEMLYNAYLYWTPHPKLAASAEVRYDIFDRDFKGTGPTQVETLSLPIALRYFSPLGFFAGAAAMYVRQDVSRRRGDIGDWEGNSAFVVLDAAIGYRFPQRRGLVGLEVRNLLNNDFKYHDDNFRKFGNEPAISPYIPERTILGQITLNF